MSAAHPSIFVALVKSARPDASFRALSPPHSLRDRLRAAFLRQGGRASDCQEAADRVFRAFLNVPADSIMSLISKTAVIFNPPIVDLIRHDVIEFGPVVDEQIRLAGFDPLTDPRINDRNRRYFALEMMESRIVRTFIQNLFNDTQPPESCVWLHDGILLFPCPSTNTVQDKWHAATTAATGQHIDVHIRISPLVEKKRVLLDDIASLPLAVAPQRPRNQPIHDPTSTFIAAPLDDMHQIQRNLSSFYARRGL